MPQREFWTHRHETELVVKLRIDHTDPEASSFATVAILDQAGSTMEWGGGHVPHGFAAWAFSDAVKAAAEAFDASGARDARLAFTRALKEWRQAARPSL